MSIHLKTVFLLSAIWIAAQRPVMAGRPEFEVRVHLINGEKISGTAEWRDSSLRISTKNKDIRDISYREIYSLRFMKNRNKGATVGTLVGAPVGGIGTVFAVNQNIDRRDGWDPRPMFGLIGGCCAGGCVGGTIGAVTAYKRKMDIIGDFSRFQKAKEQWREMTSS